MSQENDHTHDVFEQAGIPDELGSDIELDDQSSADTDTVRQPPSDRSMPKRELDTGKIGTVMGLGGLVIALGATVFSVVTYSKVSQFNASATVAFEDVDSNIASLGQNLTDSQVMLNALQATSLDNRAAIEALDTARIAKDVDAIRQEVARVSELIHLSSMDSEVIMTELRQELLSLNVELEDLSLQQQANTQRRSSVSTEPAQIGTQQIRILDSLDGINVVSVDSWGLEPNVVLYNPMTGEYLTAAQGDPVMGWTFADSDPQAGTVKFTNDRNVMHVRITR